MSKEQAQPQPKPDSALETVKRFLGELMQRIEPTAAIEIQREGRRLYVNLAQTSAFAEREGPSIQALEHLCDLYVRRNLREDVRVQLDIGNYRLRRTEELRALAGERAQQALAEKKRVRLEPMTPWERKTVHETLEHVEGVHTHSEGSTERHVVIDPRPASAKR